MRMKLGWEEQWSNLSSQSFLFLLPLYLSPSKLGWGSNKIFKNSWRAEHSSHPSFADLMQNSIKILSGPLPWTTKGGRKKTCYKINYNFPVDEAFPSLSLLFFQQRRRWRSIVQSCSLLSHHPRLQLSSHFLSWCCCCCLFPYRLLTHSLPSYYKLLLSYFSRSSFQVL